jgi:transposase
MSNPELLTVSEPQRRLEIFTGAGRRRTWSAEAKARIVAESQATGASVCAVARRHGLTPQQLFTWRREARQRALNVADEGTPAFVPIVLEPAATTKSKPPRRARSAAAATPVIEIEVAGLLVRVPPGMDAETVAAVLQAAKTLL